MCSLEAPASTPLPPAPHLEGHHGGGGLSESHTGTLLLLSPQTLSTVPQQSCGDIRCQPGNAAVDKADEGQDSKTLGVCPK